MAAEPPLIAETVRAVAEIICTHALAWPCVACHAKAEDVILLVQHNDGER